MIDRRHIGHGFEPFDTSIEAGRIRLFCKAIGEDSAIHFDADAARAAGYADVVAPLTFPTAIMADEPDPRAVLHRLEVDIGRVLHGEEHYEYFKPIVCGDRIRTQMRIADIQQKRGGALELVVCEYEMRNSTGALVCKASRTLIVRPESSQASA